MRGNGSDEKGSRYRKCLAKGTIFRPDSGRNRKTFGRECLNWTRRNVQKKGNQTRSIQGGLIRFLTATGLAASADLLESH